jgi:hypothetical protein
MIRQMKEFSTNDDVHGEIISVDTFMYVLREEFHKFGIIVERDELPGKEYLPTDEAIMMAADILQSSALVRMNKHGLAAMLVNHA